MGKVLLTGLRLLLRLLLLELAKLLLLLRLLLLELGLELLTLSWLLELLLRWLLELLPLSWLPPSGVEVSWSLGLGSCLELGSLLLELLLSLLELLLLRLLELLLLLGKLLRIEPIKVSSSLAPGHLGHPLSRLKLPLELLPLPEDLLLPPPLSLGGKPLLLSDLPLPHQLVLNHLGEGLNVKADEHVEGVLLSVFRKIGELILAELLELWGEGEILLVELLLLVPGEPLPGGGVTEGWESELLVLQLLGDGQPLPGGEHQGVGVPQIDVSEVGDQSLSLLGTEPWWGRGSGGGSGGCCSCGSGLCCGGCGHLLCCCCCWELSGDLSHQQGRVSHSSYEVLSLDSIRCCYHWGRCCCGGFCCCCS